MASIEKKPALDETFLSLFYLNKKAKKKNDEHIMDYEDINLDLKMRRYITYYIAIIVPPTFSSFFISCGVGVCF